MPPGGGGTSSATVRNIRPIEPSGVQHASAIIPPGRQTRSISSAVRLWSGANMCPNVEITRSKLASSNGSSCASPSIQSTSTIASLPRSRAIASRSREKSRPVARAPARAAGMVALPVPQATSSRSMPGSRPDRSITSSPAWEIFSATAA